MSNLDRLIAYQTMRAVQQQAAQQPGAPARREGWRARMVRFIDRLLS